jgi:hypothetical protein
MVSLIGDVLSLLVMVVFKISKVSDVVMWLGIT